MASGRRTRVAAAVVALSLAAIAIPRSALAAAPGPPGAPSAAEAEGALEAAGDAIALDPDGLPDRDATLALAELAAALPALEDGVDRRRARALLARPTDGAADQFGDGYDVPEEPPVCTEHVCVHYVASTRDAADPGYVAGVADASRLAYTEQVDGLGWAPPKPDGARGGDARTDVYLKELGRSGLYGYAASDSGQGSKRRKHGYVVIDNDYRSPQYPGFSEPLDAARVTLAHELGHLLQDAVTTRQDPWMFEATATWVEEKVFPEIDDYLSYLPHFARAPGAPLTAFAAGGGLRVYGTAVWNHWLEAGDRAYGPDVVRLAWEASGLTSPRDFAIRAYHRAISGAGGGGLSRELVDFAAATAEWRSGVGGFPDASRYPDMRREGRLRVGRPQRFTLDHTAYRLLGVPRLRARRIRLRVRVPRGLVSGLALVARRGGPVGGTVVRRVRFLPRGGNGAVALRAPRRFARITAVVVNADGRVRGPGSYDWRYLKDGQAVEARIVRTG